VTPPPPGRPYWICQVAGWGGFLAYVLAGYLLTEHPRSGWDIASILFFNGLVCPAITHGLRHWMYLRDWQLLRPSPLLARLTAIVLGLAAGLTAAVGFGIALTSESALPAVGMISIFAGFALALAGWLTIYFAVHSRRRREAQQLELRVIARDAQLEALRAQLNPHFLFNCLNSLRHLIGAHPERAETMVTGLAELLRYSLASDRTEKVTLADELRIVDEYLALEQVRFEERLKIERVVDPAALTARIPPMLIQTLVDNAIKHGIAELPAGGLLHMAVRVADGRTEILIANTGRLGPPARDAGRGLANAKARLRLIYGDAASLTLGEAGGTVQARLVLPAEGA
jgi:sensor histidine kinase YesM